MPPIPDRKNPPSGKSAGVPSRSESEAQAGTRFGVAQGAAPGWLPDCVFTGGKFETGLAFFADALGRITRFSRDPADVGMARRLPGQAALPGLINGHSIAWQRVLRGRVGLRSHGMSAHARWQESCDRVASRLSERDVFDAARMAFLEMMLGGITCVGEFHLLHHLPDGSPLADAHAIALQVLRAAHEVGIRIALFDVAMLRAGFGQPVGSAPGRYGFASVDAFLRSAESLRAQVERSYAADEAWFGVAPESLATVPLDGFAAIARYAHANRLRLHTRVVGPVHHDECQAEFRQPPIAALSAQGLIDKRFTVIHGTGIRNEEVQALAAARATVCVCPSTESHLCLGTSPVEELVAGSAGISLGTGGEARPDLISEARHMIFAASGSIDGPGRPGPAMEASQLLHAATVAGARSLGAASGALEIGRPADFFTVNLYDPSLAGSDPSCLIDNILLCADRKATREVWVGGRQLVSGGRHVLQGPAVARFVELQNRLWNGATRDSPANTQLSTQ